MLPLAFEMPEYTANVGALGTLRILEGVKKNDMADLLKFIKHQPVMLYGLLQETPQSESTPFHPRSLYGVAKLHGFLITKNYREAYDMFGCNGIQFYHENPRCGENFVTRKITIGMSKVKLGLARKLALGNLNVRRDWGHAKDFVEAQWSLLQSDKPSDLVIATGQQFSIQDFINKVANCLDMQLECESVGITECAYWMNSSHKNDEPIIVEYKKYFPPTEVETSLGNPSCAEKILN